MNEIDFAARLTQLREAKGVSARDMSLTIGQNAGYINSIESGKSLPSLPGVYYICDYFNITPAEFFDLESAYPEKLKAIIDDLKRLDNTQLETIAVLVKNLSKK